MIWWRRGEGEGKWGERREEGRREEGEGGEMCLQVGMGELAL